MSTCAPLVKHQLLVVMEEAGWNFSPNLLPFQGTIPQQATL
jgi:hypothetical protein